MDLTSGTEGEGGKNQSGELVGDNVAWENVTTIGRSPGPRYGHTLTRLDETPWCAVLMGGLLKPGQSEDIALEVWFLEIISASNRLTEVRFTHR